jgi:hypothetical protein
MRDVHASVIEADACDPDPTIKLKSLISNEPDNSKSDGNTNDDIQGDALDLEENFDMDTRSIPVTRPSSRWKRSHKPLGYCTSTTAPSTSGCIDPESTISDFTLTNNFD